MEDYLNIFNNKLDDLIKISISHRKSEGNGVLFCDFSNKEKLNVFYLPLYKDCKLYENFPENLLKYYIEKYENMPNSFIYFNIFDSKNELNIEYELDKKSNYSIKNYTTKV